MHWQAKLIKVVKKNRIDTQSYFLKRIRDCGYNAVKLYDGYVDSDPRKWTLLIDPRGINLMITCYKNRFEEEDYQFEFNDGGNLFPMNYCIRTVSMEVVIMNMIERNVPMVEREGDVE